MKTMNLMIHYLIFMKELWGNHFPISLYTPQPHSKRKKWDLLQQICAPENNDDETLLFEMMYTLIDIEGKSNLMNNRKGILDQIEHTIKNNFYKDATDASEYYFNRIKRKKEHGAKFADNILPESDEEFEDNNA